MRSVFKTQGYEIQQNINFTGLEIDLLAKHIDRNETLLIECKAKEKPKNLVLSEKLDKICNKQYVPDSYIQPERSVVIEVKAMNLNYTENWQTCGLEDGKAYSMRIGFMQQLRQDKNPNQATTTQAVGKLYHLQEALK